MAENLPTENPPTVDRADVDPKEVIPSTENRSAASPPELDIATLVADHHAAVYRYAFRLSGNGCDAEDFTQQTFLAAQLKLDQLRSAEHARAWLLAILRNAYFKSCRKRTPLAAASVELDMDSIAEEPPPAAEIDQQRLQAALDELTDDFKAVLLLFYFEGCSYREIAEKLELPPGTVMSRLSRAKAQLKSRLFESELHAAGRTRAVHVQGAHSAGAPEAWGPRG
jgi:RNA polymerase sigma-70 factor (ECF subfamily)